MGTGSLSGMGHAGLVVCAIEWLFATDLTLDFGAMIERQVLVVVKLWRRGLRWLGHKQRGEKHVNFGFVEDNPRDISVKGREAGDGDCEATGIVGELRSTVD